MVQCRIDGRGTCVTAHRKQKKAKQQYWLLTLLAALPLLSLNAAPLLTLERAEHLALDADPALFAGRARAGALRDQAVADGQLPDPKLGVGLYNVPLDDFSLKSQPTTQFRTKIQQAFPRGDTLRYRQGHSEWMGKAELARVRLTRRQIQRDVRLTFLELYYQRQAADIIKRSRSLFQQLVEITRSHFATGRVTQQDVLQAQLELSRLDDRATGIDGEIDEQRAQLTRWLGEHAWETVDTTFPTLAALPTLQELQGALPRHPGIQTASAQVEANQQLIKAAREQYKPGWNVGLEYRKRFGDDADGSDRADMMAAMVSVDLPLFTEKRQDMRLSASLQNAEAARQVREQKLRELRRTLETGYARWKRLGRQQALYHTRLVGEAGDNAIAALNAYQSGVSEFTSLMRARLTELDVRLQDLRVRVDRAKAQVRLLFLVPEASDAAPRVEGANP